MSAQIGRKREKESFSFFFPCRFLSSSSTHLYPNRLSWIPRKASIIIKREACMVKHVSHVKLSCMWYICLCLTNSRKRTQHCRKEMISTLQRASLTLPTTTFDVFLLSFFFAEYFRRVSFYLLQQKRNRVLKILFQLFFFLRNNSFRTFVNTVHWPSIFWQKNNFLSNRIKCALHNN